MVTFLDAFVVLFVKLVEDDAFDSSILNFRGWLAALR